MRTGSRCMSLVIRPEGPVNWRRFRVGSGPTKGTVGALLYHPPQPPTHTEYGAETRDGSEGLNWDVLP